MAPFPTINARLWLHLDCDADWFVAGWRRTSFHGLKTTGRKVHLLAAALAACQLWRVTGIKRFGAWPLCTSSWWISTLSQAGENILRISRGSEALHVVPGALKRGSDVCLPCCQPRMEHIAKYAEKPRYIRELFFFYHPPRCVVGHFSTSFRDKWAGRVLRDVKNRLERNPWHGFCVSTVGSEHRP